MGYAILDLFLCLLPARYRKRWDADPVSGTMRSGIAEAAGGLVVYIFLFFEYLQQFGALSGTVMSGPSAVGKELNATSFGVGVIGWLSFTITPGPLLAVYAMIEGTARGISGGFMHEPMASLPFWSVGAVHGLIEHWWKKRQIPPPEPDIVELGTPGDGWDLRVASVHAKTEWRSLVQIEYNGVLYLLKSTASEVVDGKPRFRYYLRKAVDTDGFHGVVHYDPFDYYKKSASA